MLGVVGGGRLGGLAPLPVGGRKAYVLIGERDWLLARIAEAPDLTLRALQAELVQRGGAASYHAIWDFFAREGVTFRKSLHAIEQHRPDVARKQDRWRRSGQA